MMNHRVALLSAALFGLMAMVGCDKGSTTGEPEAARPVDTTGKGPIVKLVEPGAEPRRVLRYALVPGTDEMLVMTMTMAMQTKLPGMPTPEVKMPAIAMYMKLTIAEKVSDNEARYEFVMTEAKVSSRDGVDPNVVEMTQKAMSTAAGLKGSAIVDTRGFNRDARMEMPAGMDPQMKQMMDGTMKGMEQMSSPLPAEAVGKGAKWELYQTIEQNGMKVNQVTLFELVEIDGDQGTLAVKVTQKADRQKVSAPGMPESVSAELMTLASTGSGKIEFNLAHLVPISNLTIDSNYSMSIEASGQKQNMDAHLDMSVTIARQQ